MVTGTEFTIVGIIIIGIGYLSKEFSPKNKLRKLWRANQKLEKEITELTSDKKRYGEAIKDYEDNMWSFGTTIQTSVDKRIKKWKSKYSEIEKKLNEKNHEWKLNIREYSIIEKKQQDSHHSITEYLPLIIQVTGLITAIIGLVQKLS